MLEHTLWHPVGSLNDLAGGPHACVVLEQPVVIWQNDSGLFQAWADRCPHRGTPLSMGQVRNGQLECAYHGWQFDATGQCRVVPALPDFVPPTSHRACSYRTRQAYGLLWVQLAHGGDCDLPAFAAEQDVRLRKVNCGPYAVDTSAPRIVENFIDLSHFAFVHEGWLGTRDAVAVPHHEVTRTATGVLATGCKAVQPKSSVHATGYAMVEYTYEVVSPYAAVLTKVPEVGSATISDLRESIALFVCPVSPETSRVWIRMAMNDFESPDSTLVDFQNTIFSQDLPILESQRPKRLPLSPRAELHCAADRLSVAYRRFLRDMGVSFGLTAGGDSVIHAESPDAGAEELTLKTQQSDLT
jgi:phenylpropionate dioxygenase-like ring-hydroxylating dioxygenase large terminal subunit